MKAIRVNARGGAEARGLGAPPQPSPAAGQAVVKTAAAGVNSMAVYQRTGEYKAPLPLTLGQEAAGVVTAVGPGVKDVRVGDRVAYTGVQGAYAEYAAVPADRLVALPDGVSAQQRAAAMLQGITAHYLATSTYPLKAGATCLVHAPAGGLVLLLVQIAKRARARRIGTVSTKEKAALARDAGADEVIPYTERDFEAEVRRPTHGSGVQAVDGSDGK